MIAVGIVVTGLIVPVHSWYPNECCNQRDCREVSAPMEKQGGYVFDNGQHVPYDKVRMSPDGKWHLCESIATKKLLCTFGPIGGF
jgi:hypothetical protein